MMGNAHRFVLVAAAVLMLFLGLSPQVIAQTASSIKGIRFGGAAPETRIVVDLSSSTKPVVFLLADPNRLVIDFSNAQYAGARDVKASGLVSNFRHGLFDRNTYRIVLDLNQPVAINKEFALSPSGAAGHRYVIDLKPASQQQFAKAVQASRKKIVQRSRRSTPAQPVRRTSSKKLIVVDPGHGGVDPGTIGVLGVNEEHIVLNISKEIKRYVEASGRYDVHLTRDRDVYVQYRRRYGIARDLGADLFISVHADSIGNKSVRGGSVYTLNERASDQEAARLARQLNKSDTLAGVDLSQADDEVGSILIDLAQRQTMNSSAVFAEILVKSMGKEIKMLSRPHRFASLIVLKSPDVPSVLLETGFMTNKDDARFLNTKAGRRKIARGVLDALDKYFAMKATNAR